MNKPSTVAEPRTPTSAPKSPGSRRFKTPATRPSPSRKSRKGKRPEASRAGSVLTGGVGAASFTEKELNEKVTNMLTADDPEAPDNLIRWGFKEQGFKVDTMMDMTRFHLVMDGNLILKDGDDFQYQESYLKDVNDQKKGLKIDQSEQDEDTGSGDKEESSGPLRNQFNFSERGVQTFVYPPRDKQIFTEPPAVDIFFGTVSTYRMYDSFVDESDEVKRKEEMEKVKEKPTFEMELDDGEEAVEDDVVEEVPEEELEELEFFTSKGDSDPYGEGLLRPLQLAERLVNQNSLIDLVLDYRYWEDPSDQFREGQGSLLPLWTFSYDKLRKKSVTWIEWNPKYKDLFAVAFGTFKFQSAQSSKSSIVIYSLKSPAYPEFTISTESDVMCLDWHKTQCHLLAAGFGDGNVGVYDMARYKANEDQNIDCLLAHSNSRTGKHTDPVWQIVFHYDGTGKDLRFFSLSTDGSVMDWTVVKSDLQRGGIVRLKKPDDNPDVHDVDENEKKLSDLSGGMCFAFNRESEYLYVVGTDDGYIHMCSKAYTDHYLTTYHAHSLPVYRVCWNPCAPDLFLSASEDWTVKLWDRNNKYPVAIFDIGTAVQDVAWSPNSCTVFALTTLDGKIHVYDLDQNRYNAVCVQQVVRKGMLTRIAFNPTRSAVLVGDDAGNVYSLKLSPNLRKVAETAEAEAEKMKGYVEFAVKNNMAAGLPV